MPFNITGLLFNEVQNSDNLQSQMIGLSVRSLWEEKGREGKRREEKGREGKEREEKRREEKRRDEKRREEKRREEKRREEKNIENLKTVRMKS